MKVSALINHLQSVDELHFVQANGASVPRHFHITEMGLSSKHFIDCGGTIRTEKKASIQIWVAEDVMHRLSPEKLVGIIEKANPLLEGEDLDIEIEYQSDTVGKYELDFEKGRFVLSPTHTDCLAKEHCGVPVLETAGAEKEEVGCTPGGGCC